MGKRIRVKGHYRIVTRDSEGKFTSVKKWQAPEERTKSNIETTEKEVKA